jgi:hypothetical protein
VLLRVVVLVFRDDLPVVALDLVLACFDHQAHQVVAVGKRAQLAERDELFAAGRDAEVEADRVVEGAALGLGLRLRGDRLAGAEPAFGADAAHGITHTLNDPLNKSGVHVAA